MPIPTQTEMYPIVLDLMTDGKERSNKEIKQEIATRNHLTNDELNQKTNSGDYVYNSRSAWSVQYLHRAGLLDRIARGKYRINHEGVDFASQKMSPSKFAKLMMNRIAKLNPWNTGSNTTREETLSEAVIQDDLSPKEAIERSINELQSTLADELLAIILDREPAFLEKLVVDLLVKMGYGSGAVTQYGNDGGVDGIITTDALGFDPVYTQAKRYAVDHKVGRPEIQAFAGALGRYTRGIFITTSSFAANAIEYARVYPHATIILIDGRKLAQLMMDYDLGVSTEKTYSIKRIDSDYFDQE